MRKLKTPQDVRRRNFLKTVASSGIATSALKASTLGLSLMASRAGFAEGPNGIKRCVIVYIPDGAVTGTYKINSDGSLGSSALALESVKDNIVIFDGCTTRGAGHGDAGTGALAGTTSSLATYDILLEELIGDQTPIPSLHLGVETTVGNGPTISRRGGSSVGYIDNPRTAFTRLFGDNVGEVPEDNKLIEAPYAHNLAEIRAFKSKLGSLELQRLEAHEAAIEKVMSNFGGGAVAGCDNLIQDTYGWENTGATPEVGSFTQVCNMHCDTIALAFKCGLTNLATLSLSKDSVEFTCDELPSLGTFHTAIHSGNDDSYIAFRNYLSARFAYLINKLRDTTDENGDSLLDTTLVLQVTCMGHGNAHDTNNAPFTMATATKNMIGGRGFTTSDSHNLLDTVSAALGVDGQMQRYGSGAPSGLLL